MSVDSPPLGRRERNKQAKLERITAAASTLFAEHGVDEVTTQQIADAADIGAGTLFLYVKSKGELLLLVQNALYAEALERGRAAVSKVQSAPDAILALITPSVECNRVQIDNGRTYLREMVFGDPTDLRHAEALAIVAQTEEAVAGVLVDRSAIEAGEAATLARVITAVMFLSMAMGADATNEQILADIRTQVVAILPH